MGTQICRAYTERLASKRTVYVRCVHILYGTDFVCFVDMEHCEIREIFYFARVYMALNAGSAYLHISLILRILFDFYFYFLFFVFGFRVHFVLKIC